MVAKRLPNGCPKLKQTKLNETKSTVVVDGDTKWLSDRLTDEQWRKLSDQYYDLPELINYVDNQIDDVTEIKNPFKYIIAVAEKKGWERKK